MSESRSAARALAGSASDPRLLVDSSIWIEYYRPDGRPEIQDAVREELRAGGVATTPLIVSEVARGAPDPETLEALVDDFSALACLDGGFDAGVRAARIGHALRRSGRPVPTTDLLIAAEAVGADYELWHQDGHFERIADITDLRQRRF